ncbi:MAG: general secretion pathway protein GspB [Phycisphaerales bacterium]|jgi:hypothetical protein|nr:general secretion pathway protein GspB [Phycisphaerales bacterium]
MSDETHDERMMGDDQSSGELQAELMSGGEGEFVLAEAPKPKNKGLTVLLGVVLAGACAIYLTYFRHGPQSAAAATNEQSEQNSAAISRFLEAGGENIKLMERMLRSTEKVVQQFRSYPSTTQVPLAGLKANPFRYEAIKGADPAADEELARKQRAEERAAVLKSVQELQLQSIMCGESRRACMINNTLYGEGQQVESFTIEKITPDSVIVKNGSYRFELKMQR